MFRLIVTVSALIIGAQAAIAHNCYYSTPSQSSDIEAYKAKVREETDSFNSCIHDFQQNMGDIIEDARDTIENAKDKIEIIKLEYKNGVYTNYMWCFQPSPPMHPGSFMNQSHVNSYNLSVRVHNKKLQTYNNCVADAWNDARRKANDQIDSINNDWTEASQAWKEAHSAWKDAADDTLTRYNY